MVTAFKIKSAQAVSNSTLVIHRGALDTIEYADERNPYNPDTIHAIEYANRKKNKADTDAEKSPRYFNLIKKFQKRKTTYICLCVCVTEWAQDLSECFLHPHRLPKSTLI